MGIPNCGAVNPNFKTLVTDIKKWAESDRNTKLFHDPYAAAFKIAHTEFGFDLKFAQYASNLTPGKVADIVGRLNELSSSIESGSLSHNDIAEAFFASSHYGKQDPVIGQVLRDFQHTNREYSSNELKDRNLMKVVLTSLRKAAGLKTLIDRAGADFADMEYDKLDRKRVRALRDVMNNVTGAQKEYDNLSREMKELVDNSYLKIYDDMISIVEGSENAQGEAYGIPAAIEKKYQALKKKAEKDIAKGKKYTSTVKIYEAVKNGERVLKLDKSDINKWVTTADGVELSRDMAQAVTSYVTLMDGLYDTLRHGVNKRIDSIVTRMKHFGDTRSAEQFGDLKKKLQGMYMPKYEQGFYPHYVRDLNIEFMDGLMKSFDDMQSSATPMDMKSMSPDDIIRNVNLHIDKHTMARKTAGEVEGEASKYDYSRHFLNSVTNYIGDINRFNFKSFTDSHLIDALINIENIYKKEGMAKGYAKNITDFILDMTKAANADYDLDPNTRAIMRTLLSMEFISKLGINPRGAIRNGTQRFLDYVEWGPVQVRQMKSYLKDMRIKGESAENYIESVLHDAGLLFEEAAPQIMESQLARPASVTKVMEHNPETGKWESHEKTRMERIADAAGTLAGKSSYVHRMAENSNRKHTFKLAFSQMHRWLNNPRYRNELREQGKESDAAQETAIRTIAEKYATNMVLLNHFDYADYAKSKALRSKVGRFLGQFQHYSFELFERNSKIVRESKYDLKTRNFNIFGDAQGLAKLNRMAWIYFLAPLIAGSYMGINFGNIVENDTVSRLGQLKVALTGDDDEIEQAFYGKGPLLATFGGPLISDMIEIGMMMELINIEDDDLWSLFHGLEKRDPSNTSTSFTRKLRILNTFGGRFAERHLPLISGGGMGLGVAAQQEVGLYPTAAARKRQKKLQRMRENVMPENIEEALRSLEGR